MSDDKKIVITLGTDAVDFAAFPPLKLRDKKLLRAQEYNVDLRKMGMEGGLSLEEEANLLLFFVRKLRPTTTMAELEDLDLVVAGQLLGHCMRSSNAVDSPFSTRSTALPQNTGGASAS